MTAVVTGAGISHIRLFVAKQALETYLRSEGKMELTRGGTKTAMTIIAEITGKKYARGVEGKREALDDILALLDAGY